jgi:hypothetical protein
VRPVFEIVVTSDPGAEATPTPTETAMPTATTTPTGRSLYLPLLRR